MRNIPDEGISGISKISYDSLPAFLIPIFSQASLDVTGKSCSDDYFEIAPFLGSNIDVVKLYEEMNNTLYYHKTLASSRLIQVCSNRFKLAPESWQYRSELIGYVMSFLYNGQNISKIEQTMNMMETELNSSLFFQILLECAKKQNTINHKEFNFLNLTPIKIAYYLNMFEHLKLLARLPDTTEFKLTELGIAECQKLVNQVQLLASKKVEKNGVFWNDKDSERLKTVSGYSDLQLPNSDIILRGILKCDANAFQILTGLANEAGKNLPVLQEPPNKQKMSISSLLN
jgi:hypothetical protein